MSQSNATAGHIEDLEKYRHDLFDVEIALRYLMKDEPYNLDQTELMFIVQTLAEKAEEKLLEVCGWLEEMQVEAEKREAGQ